MDENGGGTVIPEASARPAERSVGVFVGAIRSGSGSRDPEDESA